MNDETILDVPHNFYHTWRKSLEWFLERPGKEGGLCMRIADSLSANGYDSGAIIVALNCAYRNCIGIYQMSLPQYNYSTKAQRRPGAFDSRGDSFTGQRITQILLAAQPEAKKSEGIRKLLARLDRDLYPDGDRPGGVSGLAMELWNIRQGVGEIDIDFTPCPDMAFARNRIKFLISLMATGEDKPYMPDRMDKAHNARNPDESVSRMRFETGHPDRELPALLADKEAEIECLKAQVNALRQSSIYEHQLRQAQQFIDANSKTDVSRLRDLLRKMMPAEYHQAIDDIKEARATHGFQINGGWNQILPDAERGILVFER